MITWTSHNLCRYFYKSLMTIFYLVTGEGGNGVNYHVQYVTEPQEIYAQGHQTM